MSIRKLVLSLRQAGVKIAMGENAYASYGQEAALPEAPPAEPVAAPSLWEQYQTPAMLAGGALLGGYGLHHYFKGQDAAKALEASTLAGAANAGGRDKARMTLGLNAADTASLNKRPVGLLNQPREQLY